MTISLFLAIACSAGAGFLVTVLLAWILRGRARHLGLLDEPTQIRSAHSETTPTGGGLTIAVGVTAAFAVFYAFEGGLPRTMETLSFWGGALLMLGAGLWDDKHGLEPKSKFTLQLAAAYLLLHAGAHLQVTAVPFVGGGNGLGWGLYSVPLSIIWVVGVINAVNLIDGLDGLATGIIGIAFLACAALFGIKGELGLMAVGIGAAFAIVGFLPHNFNPASVFMGDSGSLFLGYLMAAYTLQGSLHSDPLLALLILPVLLGVPVLDTVGAIARRIVSPRTIFAPDRGHIHHRLLEAGSERMAVLTLYLVGTWFASAAFLMGILPAEWGYALGAGTMTVVLVWMWRLGCLSPIPSRTLIEKQQSTNGRERSRETASEDSFSEALPFLGGDGSSSDAVQAALGFGGKEKDRSLNVLNVVGARPDFMKVVPLHRALEQNERFQSKVVHTGQHYDEQMSDVFFRQLELPRPDVYLGVGSGSHAQQTARIMTAFEAVVEDEQPDLVIVVGDVNSTLACALVATKMQVQVAHVEAGLRSGDRRMPEEVNRLLTDRIADYHFVTEQSGVDHLRREGVAEEKIFFVGNLMIDSLVQFREKTANTSVVADLGVEEGDYALMTMHRPATVDHKEGVYKLLKTIEGIAADRPVVFPMHPRTRNRFEEFGLAEALKGIDGLRLLEPLGYLEFLRLMETAAVVVTDSGGIQEETTFLGVPCLTVREHTERPVTVERGTNELLSLDPAQVVARVRTVSEAEPSAERPPYWDGQTAARIVDVLEGHRGDVHPALGGDGQKKARSAVKA